SAAQHGAGYRGGDRLSHRPVRGSYRQGRGGSRLSHDLPGGCLYHRQPGTPRSCAARLPRLLSPGDHGQPPSGARPGGQRLTARSITEESSRIVRGRGGAMRRFPPERIICLTEETVETLYLLGQEHRIVGVSGYAVRPKRVRREKPRVSAFTSADIPKILALEPDLVLTFSDLQAEIAASLLREGVTVLGFNQRDIAGILAMIRSLGALIGVREGAAALAAGYERHLAEGAARFAGSGKQPLVYFEEWDEPLISGIKWVSELIEIAGGREAFPEICGEKAAKDRTVTADQVIAAQPEVILASWCGKKVRPEKI